MIIIAKSRKTYCGNLGIVITVTPFLRSVHREKQARSIVCCAGRGDISILRSIFSDSLPVGECIRARRRLLSPVLSIGTMIGAAVQLSIVTARRWNRAVAIIPVPLGTGHYL